MGKIYAKAILRGSRTIASVPSDWREAAKAALREMCDDETYKALVGEA